MFWDFLLKLPFKPMKPFFAFLILLSISLAGCDRSSFGSPKGGVALVDLDDVAKRLGRDVVIVQELKDASGPLKDQLAAAQKDLQKQFDQTKDAIGAKPSETDSQKLADLGNNLNLQLQQKQQQAQQELNTKRAALVTRFREEIKPVALKIAAGKGLGVVLVKSEVVVLGSQPGLDITDEVVAELISTGSAVPVPSVSPKL